MDLEQLTQRVITALEEMKAKDIKLLDVAEISTITDRMIIASGTSSRHVTSVAQHVVEEAKKAGCRPLGVEGEQAGEWVLVDLGDVVVHVMQPAIRDFYQLERLWSGPGLDQETAS